MYMVNSSYIKFSSIHVYTQARTQGMIGGDLATPFQVNDIFICYIIGERSEPLSRVFNDQPRDIYIYGRCPTVRTFLIRMPMHV